MNLLQCGSCCYSMSRLQNIFVNSQHGVGYRRSTVDRSLTILDASYKNLEDSASRRGLKDTQQPDAI